MNPGAIVIDSTAKFEKAPGVVEIQYFGEG